MAVEKFIQIYEKNSEKVYNLVEELRQTTDNLESFAYLVNVAKTVDKYKENPEYKDLVNELNELELFKISESICDSCFIQTIYLEQSKEFINNLDKKIEASIDETNNDPDVKSFLDDIIYQEDVN